MVKYQGSKRKYAGNICNIIRGIVGTEALLGDYCCGSGEISHYWSRPTVMVDSGPWGLFWHFVSVGHFNRKLIDFLDEDDYEMSCFKFVQRRVPEDPRLFCLYFLALQREAFQGKPVDVIGKQWKHPGWDGKFSLKAFERSWKRAMTMKPVRVYYENVNKLKLDLPAIYVDPDYPGVTGYNGRTVKVLDVCKNHPNAHIFVSSHTEIPGPPWDKTFNVSIDDSGREARGSSVDDSEYLFYRAPINVGCNESAVLGSKQEKDSASFCTNDSIGGSGVLNVVG